MSDSSTVSRPRRWLRRLLRGLTVSLFLVGPWPVDDSGFDGSAYQARTLDRLDSIKLSPSAGLIRVGVAEVDLTPTSPRPLAGFIGQIRTPFVGVDAPCLARALSVERGDQTVTILTADLLLIDARMARAVVERAGLRADQVYFTSSHTHGGPGGWGNHPLEMLVAGAYDANYFETLVNQLTQAVRQSRTNLEPAELGFVQVQTHGRQRNRVDPKLPTHDPISALIFRPLGASADAPPLAVLVVFGAHATVSHPVPPRLGSDYPGALVAELKRKTGAKSVLFASGAVGDASPTRPKAASQFKSAEALGKSLAGDLMSAIPATLFDREVVVNNLRLDVDLPPVRLPFFDAKLRFSPAMTWWIADRKTHLHALRIGPAVLVGFPGDYSGHLALNLEHSSSHSGLSVVPTSFDGDFRGYLVSGRVFRDRSCYETRWMSFYGPVLGDYFNDIARRMIDRLSVRFESMSHSESNHDDQINRLALGLLVGLSLVFGWPKRREIRERAKSFGWLTSTIAVGAVLGFLLAPDLFAWAKFGAPLWLRLIGLPIGLIGLRRGLTGKGALLFGLGCALLSASWVVVLMDLRGWIKSSGSGLSSPRFDHAITSSVLPMTNRAGPRQGPEEIEEVPVDPGRV